MRALAVPIVALMLTGCAQKDGSKPVVPVSPQEKADILLMSYTPVKTLALLCQAGISKPCHDVKVREAISKALPVADAAVAEAARQIAASPDRTSVAKWTGYAMSAIAVLAQVLETWDVKE